jgi:DNA-directed RNA polymerase subunit H (RpoH/RPB5)
MSLKSNRILSIYKSRNTIIEHLESLGYDTEDYKQFSINEIDAMTVNEQLDMLVSRKTDGKKAYIKYLLNIKQLRKDNLDQLIEDLYDIENVLEKKDTLIVVVNEEPNDTMVSRMKYLYDHDRIFVVMHYIKRLQFNILKHVLVPNAVVLLEPEIEELKKKYNISNIYKLPEISRFDPQALALCLHPGNVIKITRKSSTALEYNYYRICI